ncbi:MAG: glycosyltransferase [Candidatus Omnitrophota bacterium]
MEYWLLAKNHITKMNKLNKPAVSVIIPTYNRANLLCRALKSVLNQTYQDFEVLIIDDCSTDDTTRIVKSVNDKRLAYIYLNEQSGAAHARNIGIKHSRGEFIAFQDSDDEWTAEKLQEQMDVIQHSSAVVGVVYSAFYRIEGDKTSYICFPEIKKKEGNIHSTILRKNFIDTTTVLVRKICFEKSGLFDRSLPRLQDWELWIRVSQHYHFKYITEPLVKAYCTAGGISANDVAYHTAREIIFKKHFAEIRQHPALLAENYYYFGNNLCLEGEINSGRSYIIKALKIKPLNLKILIAVFLVLYMPEKYAQMIKALRYFWDRLNFLRN